MGWSYDEELIILNEEGVYRVYDLQGEYSQHSLGQESQESGVVDAIIHEFGMVALTGSLGFVEVKGWEGGRPIALVSPGMRGLSLVWNGFLNDLLGLSQPPICWDIIPPDQTISRHVEVLLPHENTILSVDNLDSVDQVRR